MKDHDHDEPKRIVCPRDYKPVCALNKKGKVYTHLIKNKYRLSGPTKIVALLIS